jgi:hypothetical protein
VFLDKSEGPLCIVIHIDGQELLDFGFIQFHIDFPKVHHSPSYVFLKVYTEQVTTPKQQALNRFPRDRVAALITV